MTGPEACPQVCMRRDVSEGLWQWGQWTPRKERPIQLGGRGVRTASVVAPQRERHELDLQFMKDLV